MGGSMGAVAINRILRKALPDLAQTFNIVHLCGTGNLDPALNGHESYRQLEFAGSELPDLFALSDIALSRAGANAVFELVCLSLPALLVPLPSASSRGDQDQNADYFARRGCFEVVPQSELTPELLHEKLRLLYQNRESYATHMQAQGLSDSLSSIIALIEQYARVR
jgi:UDP-N-acetylglucosamine--N-acetylmuramyl-(pentapeptide) pyrophosphoryl-undecaprenol N-acetylglucosamine transferase